MLDFALQVLPGDNPVSLDDAPWSLPHVLTTSNGYASESTRALAKNDTARARSAEQDMAQSQGWSI